MTGHNIGKKQELRGKFINGLKRTAFLKDFKYFVITAI